MATEEEVGLAIEDMMGINSQVTSEDLQDQFYKKSQNLYERRLGELQPRGGAASLYATAIPSNIVYVGKTFTLRDRNAGKTKMAHVRCLDPDYATDPMINGDVTVSFPAGGTWGASGVGIANAFIGTTEIQLVACGFGIYKKLNAGITAGLPVSGDAKTLRVSVAAPFANQNVVGIEVYAKVRYSFNGATATRDFIYVGYIDLVANPSGDFDFPSGPITLGAADPGPPEEVGSGSATFTILGSTAAGNLTPGKTYYVSVLSQHLKYGANGVDPDARLRWKNSVSVAVTLTADQSSIFVSCSAAASAASIVAIGTHPQLLKPADLVTSNSASFSTTITKMPTGPAVVFLRRISTGPDVVQYQYLKSNVAATDALIKYDSVNSRYRPVFIDKFGVAGWGPNGEGNPNFFLAPVHNGSAAYLGETVIPSGSIRHIPDITRNGDISVKQHAHITSDLVYFVPRPSKDNFDGQPYTNIFSIEDLYYNAGNTPDAGRVFHTDSFSAARIIYDFGTPTPPRAYWINSFKETVHIAGGIGEGYNRVYFANPFNPYRWSPAAAAVSTQLQYIQVESGGEQINGLGIYTNTSGTEGPQTQLVISKINSLWLLSDFPVYSTTGDLNSAVMTQLSGKVGSAGHETFANSTVGLITASIDGVWLIRESGEPTPIGDEIKNELINENPSLQTVDASYWNACVHENHYKLSYSVNGEVNPSKELWLNINKMKQMKGQPNWNGPHVGRALRFSHTDDPFGVDLSEERVGSYGLTVRWAKLDDPSVTQDYGTSLSFDFETRDYPLADANSNKLHTRTNWRMKIDASISFTETTTVLNEAGEQSESLARVMAPIATHVGGSYTTFLTARQKIYQFFPVLRLRGETVRKRLQYTGTARFAISGFTVFFRTEGRRAGS